MNEKNAQDANQYKWEKTGSIYDESITIKGENYHFEEQLYFDNKVSIMLPENFEELPETIKKIKYPGDGRPQIIRSIPGGGIDFGISLLPLDGSDAMTKQVADQMYLFTRNMKPSEVYIDKMEEKNEMTGQMVSWYDFISHGIDARIYNYIGVTNLAGKTAYFVFNCSVDNYEFWKKVVHEVLFSLKDYKQED